MKTLLARRTCFVELVTPRIDSTKIDEDLQIFRENYHRLMENGYVASITDNPLGQLRCNAVEVIEELNLPVFPEQVLFHLNAFHSKADLDNVLIKIKEIGGKYILVVSGDGGPRMHRLTPDEIGAKSITVTSIELLAYIRERYSGVFICGVAYNQYEPLNFEIDKLVRKKAMGAQFIITQPQCGGDVRILDLEQFGLPLIVGVWMSKNLNKLSECVGNPIQANALFDPMQNFEVLVRSLKTNSFFLVPMNFKTHLAFLSDLKEKNNWH